MMSIVMAVGTVLFFFHDCTITTSAEETNNMNFHI